MSTEQSPQISLHSKYRPQLEAQRYLDSLDLKRSISTFLLIEPGHGYLSGELRKRYPRAKVLEVHCDPVFAASRNTEDTFLWTPVEQLSLWAFLSTHIHDLELGSLELIEWPPAERRYGESYHRVLKDVLLFLQNRRSVVHTTGIFGPLWLRNTFLRLLSSPIIMEPFIENRPILVAAGGPSLESAIQLLKSAPASYAVWALPSALRALRAANIPIDLLIHSDPGYYAQRHLLWLPQSSDSASPLFAALPTRRREQPTLLLHSHSRIEDFFISRLSLPAADVIAHGTVAGTALSLAERYSRGPVIFSGLDLEFQDIKSHVSPHGFDELLFASSHRFDPIEEVYYRRSPRSQGEDKKRSFALNRYKDWFSSLPPQKHGRYFRLFPSSTKIPFFLDINNESDLKRQLTGSTIDERSTAHTVLHPHRADTVIKEYFDRIEKEIASMTRRFQTKPFVDLLRQHPLATEFLSYCCYPQLFRVHMDKLKDGGSGAGAMAELRHRGLHAIDKYRQVTNTLGATG
ncbi:MAG TPA: DUF115 domain-containing protein [Sediminispirochaeta sp.]|nr:DUF115 domain-containing protein [Sediminispirochaeta sp.]